MTGILILYYSMYGHVQSLARAVADGARAVDGIEARRAIVMAAERGDGKYGSGQNGFGPLFEMTISWHMARCRH